MIEPISISGIFSESFWWASPILVTLTMTITSTVNNYFNITNTTVRRLISWGTGAILSVLAWVFEIVQMGTPEWLSVVAFCITVCFSSNGVWSIDSIREFIEKITRFGSSTK